MLIAGENEVTLPPPLTRVVPVEVVYQSIVHPLGAVALKVTVPDPQRELLLGFVGTTGRGFSVTTGAPFIVTGQYVPNKDCAVYVPATLNEPLNVAGLPVPVNVAPLIGKSFLYS